jgi:hypothetical protein
VTQPRWRLAAAAALLVICIGLGSLAASRALWYETTDFYCLWQGARLVASGEDPYDEAVWAQATGGLHPDPSGTPRPSSCPGRYGYPLWTAVLLIPLGLLSLPSAATAWAGISFVATAVGALASWRAVDGPARLFPVFAAIVLAAQPLWLLVISGQLTGVMLGLVGISALWLVRGADAPAGASFAFLALKPQIVGLYAPAVFLRALRPRPRFAIAAALAFTGLVAVTLAIAPGWPLEWLGEISGRRLRVTTLLPTAWGLSADLFGTLAVAPVLIVAVAGLSIYLARRQGGLLAFAAIALPLSLFAAPYAWSYDQLVLVFPWAFTLAVAGRSSEGVRLALLVGTAVTASLLPWALYAIAFARGFETLNAAIPALTAILAAAAAGARRPGS